MSSRQIRQKLSSSSTGVEKPKNGSDNNVVESDEEEIVESPKITRNVFELVRLGKVLFF